MKIGISGASGKLGSQVLDYLLQSTGNIHQIVGISRSPENAPGGVEGRKGDYDAPASLVDAYQGLDSLLIIPSADLRPGVRGTQLKAAIDAANKAGVKHIVLMSASGTKQAPDASVGGAYWQGEQHLIRTAAAWTILRMNYYAESMVEEIQNSVGTGVLAGFGSEGVAYVSRADVAAAAANILTGSGHEGAIYAATGPASLSGEQRAALVAEVTGKPINFMVVPTEQFRKGMSSMGLPDLVINAVVEIKSNFVRGGFDIVTGDILQLTGRAPRPFRDVLAEMMGTNSHQ